MDPRYTIQRNHFLQPDGRLKLVRWAADAGVADGSQHLKVDLGPRLSPLAQSVATGEALVANGALGADVIRLAAGQGFVPHTHEGDHLLFVIGGEGTITYDGRIYPTRAGEAYLIEGKVPHAVGARTDHVLLAVGSPHKPIDGLDRMTPVEYVAVTTAIGVLHCLICDIKTEVPTVPHELGCPHCPCSACASGDRLTASDTRGGL